MTAVSRRDVLKSALFASAALAVTPGKAGAAAVGGRAPSLTFGILSDMHVTDAASCACVEKTLRFFRDAKVDAVVMAGDLIDNGFECELKLVADAWYRVFPNDGGADGAKVEKLFVYGNHDVQRWTREWAAEIGMPWDRVLKEDIWPGDRRREVFERLFREPWSPCWLKRVKGYAFVGCDYQYRPGWQRRVERAGEPSLRDFLESHRRELAGEKPFFYIQHMHPKGTCSAPWTWGQDDGTSTEILKTFPNCVALSGHSHTPLNDERTLWRGDFTSVGTAALGFLIPFGGRENSEIDGVPDTGDQLLPRLRPADGKHAMIARVYPDRVTFERRDMANDLSLGADWVVPLPARAESFVARARTCRAPAFAADARVTVGAPTTVRNRRGEAVAARVVTFPNACVPRAFDYEVALEELEVDVLMTRRVKRVYAEGFYRGEAADAQTVSCPFAQDDFPEANSEKLEDPARGRRWRFRVTPLDSFGNRGRPLTTEWCPAAHFNSAVERGCFKHRGTETQR